MRRVPFFIVVLVALSLPCAQVPEWAGLYDDTSNDFVLMSPRAERLAIAASREGPRSAIGAISSVLRCVDRTFPPVSEMSHCNGVDLQILFSIQKK
jgi:hypothetical protein